MRSARNCGNKVVSLVNQAFCLMRILFGLIVAVLLIGMHPVSTT
jgi:hypothetical protein